MLERLRSRHMRPAATRKKKLLRDFILFLASLLALLVLLDFPIPTAELARRATERQGFFGPGEVILFQDSPRPVNTVRSSYDRYYIERWGEYYAWVSVNHYGLFWQTGKLDAVQNDPTRPLVPLVVNGDDSGSAIVLLISNDPAIASVEVSFPAAVYDVGGYTLVTLRDAVQVENCFLLSGEGGWSNHTGLSELRVRGYSAGGALLYASPTPACWAENYGLAG